MVRSAVHAMRAAGIQPTDIGGHNSLWNGSHVTIVDFVDDEVLG